MCLLRVARSIFQCKSSALARSTTLAVLSLWLAVMPCLSLFPGSLWLLCVSKHRGSLVYNVDSYGWLLDLHAALPFSFIRRSHSSTSAALTTT